MTRREGVVALIGTTAVYMAAPDVLNKIQTVLFLFFIFCCFVGAVWAIEEFEARIRAARRVSRRKRKVVNIDFSRTGMVEIETGKEVVRTS